MRTQCVAGAGLDYQCSLLSKQPFHSIHAHRALHASKAVHASLPVSMLTQVRGITINHTHTTMHSVYQYAVQRILNVLPQ